MSYATEVANYLNRKGAIELVIELPFHEGRRYTDLEPHIPVSSTTLSKRLAEGVKCSLFELNQRPVEYGTEKLYKLSRLGKKMFEEMKDRGMVQTYHRLKELREQHDENKAEFLEWADRSEEALAQDEKPDDPWDELATLEDHEEYENLEDYE